MFNGLNKCITSTLTSLILSLGLMQANAGVLPTATQIAQEHDAKDLQNAVIAYRFWFPTVSAEALTRGSKVDGEAIPVIAAKPYHLGFTLNSDTPYAGGSIDLSQGPMVVELPKGAFIGLADDHHQRWIIDMGLPGADKGNGGKYLIVPPKYQGSIPADYHVGHSSTYKVILAFRALPAHGDEQAALDNLKKIKIYPLNTASSPKLISFVDMSGKKMDTSPLALEDNLTYWEVLHSVISSEPILKEFNAMYGVLNSLGISKGKPFNPDERLKAILIKASKIGHEQMLISAFASTRADKIVWPDRTWEWAGLIAKNADFDTPNGMDIEARDRWFYQAIVASPAMFRREPGTGSLYWLGVKDNQGTYLDGGKNYELNVPLPVPAKLFWSVTVYDTQTRSQVQTDQNKAALRSLVELSHVNNNTSSITLYFGPTAPKGKENLWIKTIPGKNWFAYFRIYGPEQAVFTGQWKPGDFHLSK